MLLAGPISHTSTRCMDFVEIFNIILDLSVTFSHFSGMFSFLYVYSDHSILECYNLFSGVELSMRSFFVITFIIDSGGKLSTWLYDKRDDFDFHIVNFPYLSSNIPSGPSYGVYISQLIRYARCCSHYDDFRYRHKCLVD